MAIVSIERTRLKSEKALTAKVSAFGCTNRQRCSTKKEGIVLAGRTVLQGRYIAFSLQSTMATIAIKIAPFGRWVGAKARRTLL